MSDRMRLLGRWALVAGFIVLATAVLAPQISVRESITEFLPTSADRDLDRVFQGFANSEQARRMVLSLRGPDERTTRQAARDLTELLRRDPEIAWIESSPDPQWGETVYQLYFPRRLLFLSPSPEIEVAQRLSEAGLRTAARDLKDRLAGPLAPLARATAVADPLGAFAQLVDRLSRLRPAGVAVVEGNLMTSDRRWALVFLGTRSSPFETSAQAPFLERLQAAFAAVNRDHNGGLVLESSGIHRFATASADAIRADMVRISVLSTVAIAIAFLALFRSLVALCATLVPLALGMLAAFATGAAAPNGLHVLTLAFGATLLGVCVDYPIHYLTHRALLSGTTAQGDLRAVWSGLLIGALTTAVGFACLALSPYPGIRELAIFSATGVIAAFVSTRWVLPALVVGQVRPRAGLVRGATLARRLLEAVTRHHRLALLGPLTALAITVAAPFTVRWSDDVKRLNTSFPELEAEETAVRGRVSNVDSGQFVISLGADDEEALRVAEQVDQALDGVRRDGLLGNYRSITSWVWSTQLQQRNLETVRAVPGLGVRLSESFAAEGFRPDAFADFERSLGESPVPLTFAEVARSQLGRVAQSHRIIAGDAIGFVTFLEGITNDAALAQAIAPIAGARYVDQQAFLHEAYGAYRRQAVGLFGFGILLVMLIVAWRYRRLRLIVVACGPALLGIGVSLGLLGLCYGELHLLHVLAALLVFGMGVDYGVFLLESRQRPAGLEAATLSVVLAAVFTVLSFGLLALSENGALRALGLTIAIGIPTSLTLAILMVGILAARDTAGSDHAKG